MCHGQSSMAVLQGLGSTHSPGDIQHPGQAPRTGQVVQHASDCQSNSGGEACKACGMLASSTGFTAPLDCQNSAKQVKSYTAAYTSLCSLFLLYLTLHVTSSPYTPHGSMITHALIFHCFPPSTYLFHHERYFLQLIFYMKKYLAVFRLQ